MTGQFPKVPEPEEFARETYRLRIALAVSEEQKRLDERRLLQLLCLRKIGERTREPVVEDLELVPLQEQMLFPLQEESVALPSLAPLERWQPSLPLVP